MKAALHIQVAKKNNSSFLKNIFFTPPFKVMNITEDKNEAPLHLMLMSSSPGILDADEYDIKIEVEQNATLHLHTQAYQRLFRMKLGASQQMEVRLQDASSFCFLPHPTVPHEKAVFTSKNYFYLGNACRLVYAEIITCGRKLNNEAFLFSKYHSITQVFLNNKLVIKENLLMQPALINANTIGQLEGYTHQASMIFLLPDADIKKLQEELIELLSTEKNIDAGISLLQVNGLIIRLLGNGAEQLFNCLQRINAVLPQG